MIKHYSHKPNHVLTSGSNMTLILGAILVSLKIIGKLDWPWWLTLIPLYPWILFLLIMVSVLLFLMISTIKSLLFDQHD